MEASTLHKTFIPSGVVMFFGVFFLVGATWFLHQHIETKLKTFTSSEWQQHAQVLSVPQNRYIAVEMGQYGQINELSELRKSFADMRRAWDGKREAFAKIAYKGNIQKPKIAKKQPMTTGELFMKVAKVLVLDEVNSFVEKAQLLEEVSQHVSR